MPLPRTALLALLGLAALSSAWAADSASATAASPSASASTDERDILLSFAAGMDNWEEVQASRGFQGWTVCSLGRGNCLPVCSWGGVECDPFQHGGNFVTALRLGCNGCAVPLRGKLVPGLHRLQYLIKLDLYNNSIGGELPPEWGEPDGFPAMQEMDLSFNELEGVMAPDQWSIGPSFNSLVVMQMSSNRLSGTFPPAFAVSNTSFVQLEVFSVAYNQLTGPLPPYINGLQTFTLFSLHNNSFTGTIPPDWGNQGWYWNNTYNDTQTLAKLTLHGNDLTGGIPAHWAGANSFTALSELTLSNNPRLGGSLPDAWGDSADCMPALQYLNVSNCGLSGQLPAWGPYPANLVQLTLTGNNLTGSMAASWEGLQRLQRVTLQPGNPGLCTVLPPGAQFQLCRVDEHPVMCYEPYPSNVTQACSGIDNSTTSGSGSGSSEGSSFPVAAVAVPVAVLVAALAAAGVWKWRGRRRALAAQDSVPSTANGLGPGSYIKEGDLDQSPVGGYPPSQQHSGRSNSGGAPALAATAAGPLGAPAVVTLSPAATPARGVGLWQFQQQQQLFGSPSQASSRQLSSNPSGSIGADGLLPNGEAGAGGHAALASTRPSLQLSDWEIRPEEIEILRRPDGSPWQLGTGGFGTVFKALRNGVQPVAVKVLTGTPADGGMLADSAFADEISILRACRDTNILQFQGACVTGDQTLLVTEYCEGGNLSQNLRARRVSWWRRGRKIALDVARALVYLHSRRIIHMDIKSANVLLTRDGTAKVGDVGMAKVMAQVGDCVTGVVGTLAWSAPESLLGARCTAKADIYSMGVVLWEICTGEPPVRGQMREPAVPQDCPAEVAAIITRCLNPDPAARPSAAELVELLQATPATPPAGTPSSLAHPFGGSGSLLPQVSMGLPPLPPAHPLRPTLSGEKDFAPSRLPSSVVAPEDAAAQAQQQLAQTGAAAPRSGDAGGPAAGAPAVQRAWSGLLPEQLQWQQQQEEQQRQQGQTSAGWESSASPFESLALQPLSRTPTPPAELSGEPPPGSNHLTAASPFGLAQQ